MSEDQRTIKQVIVMRHDLKMSRGKQTALAAHGSMSFMSHRFRENGHVSRNIFSKVQREWMVGAITKVCCRVDSDVELMTIHDKAVAAGLEVHLITDCGTTELPGVPTRTCLAIGPDESEKIDRITGHLRLS